MFFSFVKGVGAAGAEVGIGGVGRKWAVLSVRVVKRLGDRLRVRLDGFSVNNRAGEGKAGWEVFAGSEFETFGELGAVDAEEFAEFGSGVRFEALAAEETELIDANTNAYHSLGEGGFG